jgi:hypothetical protein
MPPSANPFTVLSYVSGPALLTNATALLLLSTSNRFARAIDRSRALLTYLEGLPGARPKAGAANELLMSQHRVRLLGEALFGFYLAAAMFAMATMISIVGAVAGEYISGIAFEVIITFAAVCGLVGFIALIAGTVSLIHESRLAVRSLVFEAEDAAGAINRALAPNIMTELEADL